MSESEAEAEAEACCCGEDAKCYVPLNDLLNVLSKKYAMAIICVLGVHDELRFGEIEEHIPPASTSTITDRLEELAETGLVRREQYDEIPPRVEYSLTEDGREACDRLDPLLDWLTDR